MNTKQREELHSILVDVLWVHTEGYCPRCGIEVNSPDLETEDAIIDTLVATGHLAQNKGKFLGFHGEEVEIAIKRDLTMTHDHLHINLDGNEVYLHIGRRGETLFLDILKPFGDSGVVEVHDRT